MDNSKHTGEKYPLSHGTEAKTETELCEALGVKYTTLSDWVNGKLSRIDKSSGWRRISVWKICLLEDRNHLPQDAIPYTPRPTKQSHCWRGQLRHAPSGRGYIEAISKHPWRI